MDENLIASNIKTQAKPSNDPTGFYSETEEEPNNNRNKTDSVIEQKANDKRIETERKPNTSKSDMSDKPSDNHTVFDSFVQSCLAIFNDETNIANFGR